MEEISINRIIKEIKDRELTAYEISKNTPLSEDGINKILSGASKNPRKTTLLILHDYLFRKEQKKAPTIEGLSMEDVLANAVFEKLKPLVTGSQENHKQVLANNKAILEFIQHLLLDVDEMKDHIEELQEKLAEVQEQVNKIPTN